MLRPQLDNHLVPMTVKARADMTRRKVKDIFRAIDSDGSGEIDISEFGDVMVLMGKELDETDLRDMFNEIDEDGVCFFVSCSDAKWVAQSACVCVCVLSVRRRWIDRCG